jgi:Zn finger protein HypA/HybF involved in hydrogenase expression
MMLFLDPQAMPERAALDGDCRACGRATWGDSEFCPRCHELAAKAIQGDWYAIEELRLLSLEAAS